MANRALGLIEVKGYLGAVVAADAAVKAANVTLLNIETVKAGLNTVQLTGDIGAVKAAVDAAVDAIREEPYYLTSHVIPRLDGQAESLLKPKQLTVTENRGQEVAIAEEVIGAEVPVVTETAESVESPEVEETAQENDREEGQKYSLEALESLKVVELRSIAYREDKVGLTKKEIKFANKRLLIEALTSLGGKE